MTVFVTVGSTSFDDLIESVCTEDVFHLLKSQGYKKIILQIGRGTYTPKNSHIIDVEWFSYKDNISKDIKNSSLVIGHAGAGTILESLIEHKPLITVLNNKLMDNHQMELAEQMAKEGYLLYCKPSEILSTLQLYFQTRDLKKYVSEQNAFPEFLDKCMGLR